MKRIKMGLMAFAALTSIGSAFAFSPAAKKAAVPYYAIKTGEETFRWTDTEPLPASGLECSPTDTEVSCAVVTDTQPAPSEQPGNHPAEFNIYK